MTLDIDTFLKNYLTALEDGTAALFAGAGLSKPAAYVDWKALLADVIEELKLHPDTENLVAAAQYHVNERGSRGHLNQKLIAEFTRDASPTENHRYIAQLPIETIWTTNYDELIEDALKSEYKSVDIKHRQSQLATTKPGRQVTLFKMHGDISAPEEAVLVKEDYELYDEHRRLFSYQLQGDLVSKTFLFVGFSFTDPNVDYLLSRIRGLMGQNVRSHYCLMKRVEKEGKGAKAEAEYQYTKRRQELFVGDLKRYGIQTVLLDSYRQVTEILALLHKLVHRKNVFVSGSADDFGPLGKERLETLCRALGHTLIDRGKNLTSGFGSGVGGLVTLGAMEATYKRVAGRVENRLTLRPFPQAAADPTERAELWRRYREEMLVRAGAAIFVAGNKLVNGELQVAEGCLEEFEIARRLKRVIIPIGCSGHASAQIWEEVSNNVQQFFPDDPKAAKAALAALNDANTSVDELLKNVFVLLDLGSRIG